MESKIELHKKSATILSCGFLVFLILCCYRKVGKFYFNSL
ncbi:hypothetical protein FSS13T_06980 [Flavobacterium saliperosum S13]|uniref:Lipoprotein n=1 Tax=Flavobacterium saliperosum S13 TaxID=1341155 RepID=A0ABN0QIB5_9FLAO|nr:hypothetical protein FSS13T_06980 [Flavobacterium saliperosum S13]